MARNAKFAYFVAVVLGRAQQAAGKCQQQVKSARASPLVLSPIANQPHRFSDSRKMAKNAKCAFCFAMALGHADSRRNTHLQVGAVRASPLAFSPDAEQPRRFPDSREMAKNAKCAFCVVMALGRARQAAGEILTCKSILLELALLLLA